MFQIWTKFAEYNMKRKSLNYNLPESDILDLTEELCGDVKTWEKYISFYKGLWTTCYVV